MFKTKRLLKESRAALAESFSTNRQLLELLRQLVQETRHDRICGR